MSDTRTLVEKLEAMAASTVNEHEADVAARKLLELRGKQPPPPNRPTAVGASTPEPWNDGTGVWGVSYTNVTSTTVGWTVRVVS